MSQPTHPPPQPVPRPLRSDEQRLVNAQATESDWDEDQIGTFISQSQTQQFAVDLTGGGKLLFVSQEPAAAPQIALETNALFTWLGVPSGFTLILFWRDDPRTVTATEWPSRRSVNGGYTYPGSNNIIVYRQEEWDRVLIHETIHAMKWDWDVPATPMPCWGLGTNAVLAPHLFEAWTELYAEWLWCGWHNKSWDAQYNWMVTQARQILARQAGHPWKENTNLFAYYILKTALAPHIGFLWTLQNGMTPAERAHVLCDLVAEPLAALRREASRTTPAAISMRMTMGAAPT